jgi:hypothetical protein
MLAASCNHRLALRGKRKLQEKIGMTARTTKTAAARTAKKA